MLPKVVFIVCRRVWQHHEGSVMLMYQQVTFKSSIVVLSVLSIRKLKVILS